MIKLCNIIEIEEKYYHEKDDVFFQKIKSDYILYGENFPFSSFYCCDDNNTVTAVISKIDSVITVSSVDKSNIDEIFEFCEIIGFSDILIDNRFSSSISLKNGAVMLFENTVGKSTSVEADSEALKDVYEILKENFDSIPDFSSWFPDISFRLRHSHAHLAVMNYDGKIVSCAFSLFENDEFAVISSVATLKEYRNRGFGKSCVDKLLEVNCNRNVYVFCDNDVAEKWYEKIGFKRIKTWSEIKSVR